MDFALSSLPLPLRLRPEKPLTDDELMRFSWENRPLRIEMEPNGEILVMTPTGRTTGKMNMRLGRLLDEWAEHDGRGVTFDSSTGFKLASGAVRSPDAAWMTNEKWNPLTDEQRDGFGPMCPDFIIELSSPSDRLPEVRRKIAEEWLANGVQLAWLIDKEGRTVTIYRPGEEPEVLLDPSLVQGTGPVRGFELIMSRMWE